MGLETMGRLQASWRCQAIPEPGGHPMRRRTDTALDRLRQDLTPHFDESAVSDVCQRLGHRWHRDALVTPFPTILWFVIQVLHGNTALTHITLKARRAFTEPAYCQARARLPLAVFRAVLPFVIGALIPRTEAEGLWRGHRTFLIDGSSSFCQPSRARAPSRSRSDDL